MRQKISAALFAAAVLSGASAAADVAPHRALYVVALAEPSDSVASARGLIAFSVSRTCEGWRFRQRFEIDMASPEGETSRTAFTLDGTETADGSAYQFRSTMGADGQEVAFVGRADRDARSLRYTEPGALSRDLPEDVYFPIDFVRRTIAAAKAGAKRFGAHWFAGASPDEPLRVNSVILPEPPDEDATGLLQGERWRLASAYFGLGEAYTPDYESSEVVTATGVLAEARYDYGDYALALRLERLEPLPEPDC